MGLSFCDGVRDEVAETAQHRRGLRIDEPSGLYPSTGLPQAVRPCLTDLDPVRYYVSDLDKVIGQADEAARSSQSRWSFSDSYHGLYVVLYISS